MKNSLRDKVLNGSIPEPNSGCWLWDHSYNPRGLGYGRLFDGRNRGWRTAHRVSWEVFRGPIPDGMHVLHKCDVPICVNPNHLFLGTQADNNRDMFSKGRAYDRRGHKNPRSKLSSEQVSLLRSMPKKNQSLLAKQFGISQSSISRVQRGEVYK